jgi:hypothetical protein
VKKNHALRIIAHARREIEREAIPCSCQAPPSPVATEDGSGTRLEVPACPRHQTDVRPLFTLEVGLWEAL